jgi:hypothetical protein
MTTAILILSTVALLLIMARLVKSRTQRDPKNVLEVLESTEYSKKTQQFFELQKSVMTKGTDQDVMPQGLGEFGLDASNPIPTLTVTGSFVYLAKLRTVNGTKVHYTLAGSTNAANIPYMIDVYEVTADGQSTTVYLCPYNKKNSAKAPRGFKVSPAQEALFWPR